MSQRRIPRINMGIDVSTSPQKCIDYIQMLRFHSIMQRSPPQPVEPVDGIFFG